LNLLLLYLVNFLLNNLFCTFLATTFCKVHVKLIGFMMVSCKIILFHDAF